MLARPEPFRLMTSIGLPPGPRWDVTSAANIRQARRLERREAILAGAAQAFAQTGFAATSMEAIAQAAGVSKLVLYRYFDSKDELYRAVLEAVCECLSAELTAALQRGEHDRAGVRCLLAAGRKQPDAMQLLWRHSVREPDFAAYAERFRSTGDQMVRAELEGTISDATSLDWAAEAVAAFMVEGVLIWLERGDPARDDEFVERLTDSCWAVAEAWARPVRRSKGRRLVVEDATPPAPQARSGRRPNG